MNALYPLINIMNIPTSKLFTILYPKLKFDYKLQVYVHMYFRRNKQSHSSKPKCIFWSSSFCWNWYCLLISYMFVYPFPLIKLHCSSSIHPSFFTFMGTSVQQRRMISFDSFLWLPIRFEYIGSFSIYLSYLLWVSWA